jgi:hypothetical protein
MWLWARQNNLAITARFKSSTPTSNTYLTSAVTVVANDIYMLNDFCACLSTCDLFIYLFIYLHLFLECPQQLKIYAAQNGRMIVNNELERCVSVLNEGSIPASA